MVSQGTGEACCMVADRRHYTGCRVCVGLGTNVNRHIFIFGAGYIIGGKGMSGSRPGILQRRGSYGIPTDSGTRSYVRTLRYEVMGMGIMLGNGSASVGYRRGGGAMSYGCGTGGMGPGRRLNPGDYHLYYLVDVRSAGWKRYGIW